MKKIMLFFILLGGLVPVTSFAEGEQTSSDRELQEVVTTETSEEMNVSSSAPSEEGTTSSTNSEDTPPIAKAELVVIKTSLFLLQGDKLTAEMLQANMQEGSAPYDNVKLLEEASTEKLGTNYVKASFTAHGPEGSVENTAMFEYQVVKRSSAEEEVFDWKIKIYVNDVITAEMLEGHAKANKKPFTNFKLLGEPVTDKIGPQAVKASFTITDDAGKKEAVGLFKYSVLSKAGLAEGETIPTSILLYRGEKLTTSMLEANSQFHHAPYDTFSFIDTPSTDKLGMNYVNATFINHTIEGELQTSGEFKYVVIEDAASYNLEFVSFDESSNLIKGRVLDKAGQEVPHVSIQADNNRIDGTIDPTDVKQVRPYTVRQALTDAQGYFTLQADANGYLFALNDEAGTYSAVYPITNNAFKSEGTAKKEEPTQKDNSLLKKLLPNTGEKNRLFITVLGVVILLLVIVVIVKRKAKHNH
ncbi:carboxypeptidase-like regulatory domain-containing protein [Enterococcus termitis]|uniref:Gram-positive cocci surface proteins LPxTG domain-containing protein n=1 Tax=Enterococcus termitis TaxID=332950 RepID=A0A1E5G989_9ENTE|nr:carboxypeptidase-like regulatory domain-containing protein [Enterococcus termitis]OEG09249.1 hypothetical protein BCR25_11830 [Enterococcus termitis]